MTTDKHAVTRYVRRLATDWIAAYDKAHSGRGGTSELARQVGIKPQPLFMILGGSRNVGDSEQGFANVFYAGSRDLLLFDAEEWCRTHPDESDDTSPAIKREIIYDERFPNLQRAILAARVMGYSRAAIAAVRARAKLRKDDDLSEMEWLSAIQTAHLHEPVSDPEKERRDTAEARARTRPSLPGRRR